MNEPHEPKLMDFLTRPVETLEALDQQESGKNDDPAKHQEPESEASHRPDPLRIMGTTLDVPMAGTARQSVESPPTVVANGRPDPIFPAPAIVRVDSLDKGGYLPDSLVLESGEEPRFLPGLAPPDPDTPPSLALTLYDLGGGTEATRGRGAPLALRLFVEAVLSVPADARGSGPVLLHPERWGDFLRRLYPSGKFRADRQWPAVRAAFLALDSEAALIPWRNAEGGWQARRAVVVRDRPRSGAPNEWVQLMVDLPPGSERGPIVDRLALRGAGVKSAPAYRLAISLSADWYRPGATRVPVRGGAHFLQVTDPRRYPCVSDGRLVAMAFPRGAPGGGSMVRKRRQRAREALAYLVGTGFAEEIELPDGRRILPGSRWAGWHMDTRSRKHGY